MADKSSVSVRRLSAECSSGLATGRSPQPLKASSRLPVVSRSKPHHPNILLEIYPLMQAAHQHSERQGNMQFGTNQANRKELSDGDAKFLTSNADYLNIHSCTFQTLQRTTASFVVEVLNLTLTGSIVQSRSILRLLDRAGRELSCDIPVANVAALAWHSAQYLKIIDFSCLSARK